MLVKGELPSITSRKPRVCQFKFAHQTDTSKCWSCSKKTGLLGFACKCGFVFCKGHRLPENHKCLFDFAEEGKKLLGKLNPVVKGDKLEKF